MSVSRVSQGSVAAQSLTISLARNAAQSIGALCWDASAAHVSGLARVLGHKLQAAPNLLLNGGGSTTPSAGSMSVTETVSKACQLEGAMLSLGAVVCVLVMRCRGAPLHAVQSLTPPSPSSTMMEVDDANVGCISTENSADDVRTKTGAELPEVGPEVEVVEEKRPSLILETTMRMCHSLAQLLSDIIAIPPTTTPSSPPDAPGSHPPLLDGHKEVIVNLQVVALRVMGDVMSVEDSSPGMPLQSPLGTSVIYEDITVPISEQGGVGGPGTGGGSSIGSVLGGRGGVGGISRAVMAMVDGQSSNRRVSFAAIDALTRACVLHPNTGMSLAMRSFQSQEPPLVPFPHVLVDLFGSTLTIRLSFKKKRRFVSIALGEVDVSSHVAARLLHHREVCHRRRLGSPVSGDCCSPRQP